MIGVRLAATALFATLPVMAQPVVTVTVWHSSVFPCDGLIEAIYELDPAEDGGWPE
jgi:hypothetical protein